MKCQILFSGKNKKNIINLSSAENAQRVVKVKEVYFLNTCIDLVYTWAIDRYLSILVQIKPYHPPILL